jgi:hypothetical protein
MSLRRERESFLAKKASPLFSTISALFFRTSAYPRDSSPFLSIVSALFARKPEGYFSPQNHLESLGPLFSYSYKCLFTQLPSFDTHTNAPGGGVHRHSLPLYFITFLLLSLP